MEKFLSSDKENIKNIIKELHKVSEEMGIPVSKLKLLLTEYKEEKEM